eukprot:scaffold191914_cov32-Tisochrysis_lutea.AAC.3
MQHPWVIESKSEQAAPTASRMAATDPIEPNVRPARRAIPLGEPQLSLASASDGRDTSPKCWHYVRTTFYATRIQSMHVTRSLTTSRGSWLVRIR